MRYQLHHVSIPVGPGQLPQGREFYGGLLGLEEIPPPESFGPERVVWFDLGGRELHLFVEADANARGSNRHLALEVEDLAALREHLAHCGIAAEEADPIPNRPRVFIHDPFGNRVEFTQIQGPYLRE